MARSYNPYKRVYYEKVKEQLTKQKIVGISVGAAIFWYLVFCGAIMPLSEKIDTVCTDSLCESVPYTFLAIKDVYIYPNESWLPENVVLKRSWGDRWRTINLSKTWNKNVKYAIKFSMGNTYTIKYFINDKIPWESVELKMFPNCPTVVGIGKKQDYFDFVRKDGKPVIVTNLGSAYKEFWDCNPTKGMLTAKHKNYQDVVDFGSEYVRGIKVQHEKISTVKRTIRNLTSHVWVKNIIQNKNGTVNNSYWKPVYEYMDVSVTNKVWVDGLKDTRPGECVKTRISAILKPKFGERNIHHYFCVYGDCDESRTWWNTSYSKKMALYCRAPGASAPVSGLFNINDTNFTINGVVTTMSAALTLTNSTTHAICAYAYYNDETDIALVDSTETNQLVQVIEIGSSSSYGDPEVNLILFMNMNDTADTSRYANSLTNNGATRVAAKIGYGHDFEESESDYIAITSADVQQEFSDLSFFAWIKIESDDTGYIISRGTGVADGYFSFNYDATSNKLTFFYEDGVGGGHATNSVSTFNTGTWYHVGFTYDSADVRIYVDGALDNTDADPSSSLAALAQSVGIGRRELVSDNYFDGVLDNIMIWNRTLSADEIMILYNNTFGTHNITYLGEEETLVICTVTIDTTYTNENINCSGQTYLVESPAKVNFVNSNLVAATVLIENGARIVKDATSRISVE